MVVQSQLPLGPVRSSMCCTWTEILCCIEFPKRDEQMDALFLEPDRFGLELGPELLSIIKPVHFQACTEARISAPV